MINRLCDIWEDIGNRWEGMLVAVMATGVLFFMAWMALVLESMWISIVVFVLSCVSIVIVSFVAYLNVYAVARKSRDQTFDLVRLYHPIVKDIHTVLVTWGRRKKTKQELESFLNQHRASVFHELEQVILPANIVFPVVARSLALVLVCIVCFTTASSALLVLHEPNDEVYAVDKTDGSHGYLKLGKAVVLGHMFYYHMVFFQSLGDAHHSPRTSSAKILATIESMTSVYLTLIVLGGSVGLIQFALVRVEPEWVGCQLFDDVRAKCDLFLVE